MKNGEWKSEGAEEKLGPKVKKDSRRVRDRMIGEPPPLPLPLSLHLLSPDFPVPLSIRDHSLLIFHFHLRFLQYTFYTAVLETFLSSDVIMFRSHIYSCSDSTRVP